MRITKEKLDADVTKACKAHNVPQEHRQSVSRIMFGSAVRGMSFEAWSNTLAMIGGKLDQDNAMSAYRGGKSPCEALGLSPTKAVQAFAATLKKP